MLNSLTIANAPPEKLIEMRTKFDEKLDSVTEIVSENNYSLSEKNCEELLTKFHDKIKEKLLGNEYQDLKQLSDDWELLKKVYKENANGPAKHFIMDTLGFPLY